MHLQGIQTQRSQTQGSQNRGCSPLCEGGAPPAQRAGREGDPAGLQMGLELGDDKQTRYETVKLAPQGAQC